MRRWSAERFLQRRVGDQAKSPVARTDDRPQLEVQRIYLSRAPHVVELDIAADLHRPIEGLRDAEVDLGARARVFVFAVGKLGGREILADFEPAQHTVCGLERLVYLMPVRLLLGQMTGPGRARVGRHLAGIAPARVAGRRGSLQL